MQQGQQQVENTTGTTTHESQTDVADHHQQPLEGAIVSVTGFNQEDKNYLRYVIENLGGRYTSELYLRRNTHLIASSVTSEKYKAAKESAPDTIFIVTPDWIEACAQEVAWVDETPFILEDYTEASRKSNANTATKDFVEGRTATNRCQQDQPELRRVDKNQAPTACSSTIISKDALKKKSKFYSGNHSIALASLPLSQQQSRPPQTSSRTVMASPCHLTSKSLTQFQQIYERILLLQPSCIFSHLKFYVISIVVLHQKHHQSKNTAAEATGSSFNNDNKCIQILHKLVRYGLGTRYDELNEDISHFIVITDAPYMDRDAENALRQLALFHPRRPSIVTPEWVAACLTQGVILPPHEYPLPPLRSSSNTDSITTLRNTMLSSCQQYSNKVLSAAQQDAENFSSACNNKKYKSSVAPRNIMGKIDVNSGHRHPKITDAKQSITTSSSCNINPSMELVEAKRMNNSFGVSPSSSIFKDSIFAIASLSMSRTHQQQTAPLKVTEITNENDVVSFDIPTTRGMIVQHGGRLLTTNIVMTLHNKAKDRQKQRSPKAAVCYVVVFGAIPPESENIPKNVISVNDMLELGINDQTLLELASDPCTKRFIRFKLVTSLWVQTCVEEGTVVSPEDFLFFQPLSWDIKRLPISLAPRREDGTANINDSSFKLRIAVTGFVGAEREGLLQTLKAMGAVYTESLKTTNTHLISKVTEGAKYNRAIEWGIHVVSVDWLYHIARYGFFGIGRQHDMQCGVLTGCEDQFSLTKSTETSPILKSLKQSGSKRQKMQHMEQPCDDFPTNLQEVFPVTNCAAVSSIHSVEKPLQTSPVEQLLVLTETNAAPLHAISKKTLTPIHEVQCKSNGAEKPACVETLSDHSQNQEGNVNVSDQEKIQIECNKSGGESVNHDGHEKNSLQQSLNKSPPVDSPTNEKLRVSLSNIEAAPATEVFGKHLVRSRRRSRRLPVASSFSSVQLNSEEAPLQNGVSSDNLQDICEVHQTPKKLPSPFQEVNQKLGQTKKRLIGEFGDDSQVVWFAENSAPQG